MAHVKLGKQANAIDTALNYIENGQSISDESILAEYHAKMLGNQNLQNRIDDNADNQNVSNDDAQAQSQAAKEFEDRLAKDLKF